jgi:hypothetical protein
MHGVVISQRLSFPLYLIRPNPFGYANSLRKGVLNGLVV